MESRESLRINQIDRELADLRRRHKDVHSLWIKTTMAKAQIERQARALEEERTALAQGQLMLPRVS